MFESVINKVNNVQKGFPDLTRELFIETINEIKEELIDLNLDQLLHGHDANNIELSSYAIRAYAEYKHFLNPRPGMGTPDLKLEGDFHAGWYLEQKNDKHEFNSRDNKTGELIQDYGEDIFGLTDKNYDVAREFFLDIVLSKIKNRFTNLLK